MPERGRNGVGNALDAPAVHVEIQVRVRADPLQVGERGTSQYCPAAIAVDEKTRETDRF